MGNGILVVRAREGDALPARRRALDRRRTTSRYHAASIISGLYALGGQIDVAFVEERILVHPALEDIATEGAARPARDRVPRRAGDGDDAPADAPLGGPRQPAPGRRRRRRSTSRTDASRTRCRTTSRSSRHPDTDHPLIGRVIPHFEHALEIAVAATDLTGLGYVGADVVVDARARSAGARAERATRAGDPARQPRRPAAAAARRRARLRRAERSLERSASRSGARSRDGRRAARRSVRRVARLASPCARRRAPVHAQEAAVAHLRRALRRAHRADRARRATSRST